LSKFDVIYPQPHRVETLAEGFATAEGPVWIAEENRLVFSEAGMGMNAQGFFRAHNGRRNSFDPATGKVSLFAEATRMGNGMTRDAEGRLLVCEMESHAITRIEPDGSTTVIAERCGDEPFRTPNDIVVAKDGAIYFTDTGGGVLSCVYRIGPDPSDVTRVATGFTSANGLVFSPDQRRLYVNDSKGHSSDPDFWMSRGTIRVFDVLSDGRLSQGRLFAVLDGEGSGTADGMEVDSDGNVYCTGPRGVWVYAPDGEHLGVIETGVVHNRNNTTNMCWGGEDGRTLFVTTSSSLLSVRTGARGPTFR
jgi:gluconolactonase